MKLKGVKVSALYDVPGLFSQLKKHKLQLTEQANRHLLFVVLMKIGPASGQKIVKKCEYSFHHLRFDEYTSVSRF